MTMHRQHISFMGSRQLASCQLASLTGMAFFLPSFEHINSLACQDNPSSTAFGAAEAALCSGLLSHLQRINCVPKYSTHSNSFIFQGDFECAAFKLLLILHGQQGLHAFNSLVMCGMLGRVWQESLVLLMTSDVGS